MYKLEAESARGGGVAAEDIPQTRAINAAVERGPDSPKKEKSAFRESAASAVHAAGADN